MDALTDSLPHPEDVRRRIDSLEDELAATRTLLRLCVAANRAAEARRRRTPEKENSQPRRAARVK
jgi:hypothetical protein